jgi:hypothetical protein
MPDTKTCAGSTPGSRTDVPLRSLPLEDERRKMIDNERWKCLAAWLNIMSAGTVFIGLVTPIFHLLSVGLFKAPPINILADGAYFSIVLGVAAALHVAALRVLGNLRP